MYFDKGFEWYRGRRISRVGDGRTPADSPRPQQQPEHKSTSSDTAAGRGAEQGVPGEEQPRSPLGLGGGRGAEGLPAALLHRRSSAGAAFDWTGKSHRGKAFFSRFIFCFFPSALSLTALKGNAFPLAFSAFFVLKISPSRRPPEPSLF